MRALLASALIAVAAGCSPGPTEPRPEALTGRWEGTFTATTCQVSGSYTAKSCLAPGATMLAGVMLLEPDGQSLPGYGHTTTLPSDLLRRYLIEGGFLRQFQTSIDTGRRLRFSVTNGAAPTVVQELSWDLQLVSESRMEGTGTLRDSWYKQPGDIRVTGTVVLTKR